MGKFFNCTCKVCKEFRPRCAWVVFRGKPLGCVMCEPCRKKYERRWNYANAEQIAAMKKNHDETGFRTVQE